MNMREKILFDFDWMFHAGDIETPMPVTKMPMYYHAKTERAQWGPATYGYKDASLKLRLEDGNIKANNEDFAIITCWCEDEEGRFVPDASPFIRFNTNRYEKLVGTGSDVCDHTPVNSLGRHMRAGLCSIAVKVGAEAGILRLYEEADNL